ncbi:MAG: glycosyltransferase family 2 protein [Anaerolineales bacterium]
MKVSVIIPVFNEQSTIEAILQRVKAQDIVTEILVIDDGSTDGTREILASMEESEQLRVILHDSNQGKGAAVRTGFQKAKGDVFLIQDADLEYDPRDYPKLIQPIQEGIADVVYGSRFLGGPRRSVMFWHMVANRMLTFMTNLLYNTILSDMETGYKLFRREIVEGMKIHANSFDFEPEFTAKILKKKVRVYEIPISFNPRDYEEGKKIGLRDAFQAVWTLVKYRFVD